MLKKPIRILGINPGTQYIGIAVLQDGEPMNWGIKSIKGKWSEDKVKKILLITSSFLERYAPDAIAIKKLHPSRSSPGLNRMVVEIKEQARESGMRIYEYSIIELLDFFLHDEERANKKKLIGVIVSEHPALFPELRRECSHKNPYYIRMFEAVAIGSRCFHQLDITDNTD